MDEGSRPVEENRASPRSSGPSARGRRKSSVLIYIFGVLGGLNWGYDTGVVSAAIVYIRQDFAPLSAWMEGWIVTGLIIGSVIGAACGGYFSDKYGRKPVLLITAVTFCIAPIGMALAPDPWTLFAFRMLVGLGTGLAAVTLPVYLSELAPAKIRGRVTGLYALSIVFGQFCGFLIGLAFAPIESWRWMMGLSVVPSVLFTIGLLFIWETPRWLMKHGREAEAREILSLDRDERQVAIELAEIEAIQRAEDEVGVRGLRALFQDWVRPILIIGVGLACFQQFMGINTVIYYAPTTLQNVGFGDQGAIAANLIIGVMNIIAVTFALFYADRIGRKPLLLLGAAGSTVSLGALALTNLLMPEPDGFGALGIITLASMAVYVLVFQASWGSIVWVMLGEIFPLGIRAAATGLATTALWAGNGVVAMGFPVVLEQLGVGWLFAGFAVICLASFVFTLWVVPETKGQSLEEIEEEFRTGSIPVVAAQESAPKA